MDTTHAVAEIISAIASLLWPMIIATSLYVFRDEFRSLLQRLSYIKKGKLFGQEFELDEKLDELRAATKKVENEIPVHLPPAPDPETQKASETLEEQLLRDTQKSPKVTLMLLAAELDKRIAHLLAATGWHRSIKASSTMSAIEQLRAQGSLPANVAGSVQLFQEVRNRIIHGRSATEEDILRAIDSGFTLLKAIDSIPLASHTVHRTNVPLYSDQNCSTPITNGRGLILETISPGGSQREFQIFPTTRTHFQVGKHVAWDWDLSRTWGPAWYKDLDTDECKQAWISSGEFIGQHLDDL